MATDFPTSLDALTNPTSTDNLDSTTVPHATQHANANDAIEALQAKVGVDSSAVTTSLDYYAKNLALLRTLADAKGDILIASAADTLIRLAVGANDTVLIADSAQTGGAKWATIPTAAITDDAVTYAKMQNISAASKLLGRGSAGGSGNAEEITLGTGLSMSGSTLNAASGSIGDMLDWQYVPKTADESVSSADTGTTLQNDDHLLFAIGAGETWVFEIIVTFNSPAGGTTPDIKLAVVAPASATGKFFAHGLATTATSLTGDGTFDTGDIAGTTADPVSFGSNVSGGSIIIKGRVINPTSAGNVTLQWAQNTSSADSLFVLTHSYLTAQRVV